MEGMSADNADLADTMSPVFDPSTKPAPDCAGKGSATSVKRLSPTAATQAHHTHVLSLESDELGVLTPSLSAVGAGAHEHDATMLCHDLNRVTGSQAAGSVYDQEAEDFVAKAESVSRSLHPMDALEFAVSPGPSRPNCRASLMTQESLDFDDHNQHGVVHEWVLAG